MSGLFQEVQRRPLPHLHKSETLGGSLNTSCDKMLRALPGQSRVRISDLAAHDTATWAMKSRRSRSLKIGPKRVLKRGMRARCRRPEVLRKSASPKAKADNAWIPGVSSGAALTVVVGGLLCLNFICSFSTQCYFVLETEE